MNKRGQQGNAVLFSSSKLYKYMVISYGLDKAPIVFQIFVNNVVPTVVNKQVTVYLDGILILSATLSDNACL